MGASEASRKSCNVSDLKNLAVLYIEDCCTKAHVDLDLPASLTLLTVHGQRPIDLFWLLLEAEKCIERGVQLRTLGCHPAEALLQPALWGARLDEQFRGLGGRVCGLQDFWVTGSMEPLLIAFSAVVSSAPHLKCARLSIEEWLPHMELPPVYSASLERLTLTIHCGRSKEPPPPVVLTFLPGCKLLRQVLVRFNSDAGRVLAEGTVVKIRCHSCSPKCIMPLDPHARAAAHRHVYGSEDVFNDAGVQLLPGPPSPQGVQSYTVLYKCHAAGPEQPEWGFSVMPGCL